MKFEKVSMRAKVVTLNMYMVFSISKMKYFHYPPQPRQGLYSNQLRPSGTHRQPLLHLQTWRYKNKLPTTTTTRVVFEATTALLALTNNPSITLGVTSQELTTYHYYTKVYARTGYSLSGNFKQPVRHLQASR